jgi:hypothetical protein
MGDLLSGGRRDTLKGRRLPMNGSFGTPRKQRNATREVMVRFVAIQFVLGDRIAARGVRIQFDCTSTGDYDASHRG